MRARFGTALWGLLLLSVSIHARSLDLSSSSTDCEECLASVNFLVDFLKDPSLTDYLVDHISQDICTELPIAKDKCNNLAQGLVPVIIQWFEAASTPMEMCTAAGACSLAAPAPAVQTRKPLRGAGDSGECAICYFVMGQVKTIIQDQATMQNVNDTAHAACASLPAEIAPVCHSLWDTYEPLVVNFIDTASPGDLCALTGLCMDSLLARTAKLRPTASPMPALAPVLRSVGQARLVAQSRAAGLKVGNACDTCRMAVIQAHMLIASPSVQESMVNYTKALCESFESFTDACKLYVDQYSPMVFALLQQYLSPDTLCTDIGMCPPPSKPAALVSQVLQLAKRTLGVHTEGQLIVQKYLQ